jgi:RHS repeat-associated protein
LRIGIDHFSSNLRSVKVKGVFPYEGIEYMGWRFNDKLGGGEGKANYWVIKGLGGGGEVSVYEVGEGGELRVEIPEGTDKINLGLVRDNVKKRLGSIFTNMLKEELVSFLAGRGLELVGFVEGVWEKSVNGDWVRPSVRDGIRYFVPLLDKEGYIISDWRGVPRVVYDEGGKEIWRGDFGPFGEPLYERGVVSNYIPFRLYGMYKDIETGLYYNVRRYYDWRVGRYLQPDPVSDLNLYIYVNNSPYDFVDPLGMFKTEMRNYPFVFLHIGDAIHEEITEDAIRRLGLLSNHGFRVNEWDSNTRFCISGIFCAECRKSIDTIAQGVNRADCLYVLDSSYHCDNSNFDGCYQKAQMIQYPESSGILTCTCTSPLWEPPPKFPPGGGGPGKGEGGGGGRGCSVGRSGRLSEKSHVSCSCSFKSNWNYEKLGQLLHAVQDFWAHSNGVFVSTCSKRKCVSRVFVCLDWECAEYKVETKWNGSNVPSGTTARWWGLFTGLFDGGGWSAADDILCILPWPFYPATPPGYPFPIPIDFLNQRRHPPCDLGQKIMAHCMLNKDNPGGDRDCMSACDLGDWPGDCGGDDSIQKYAFNDVKNRAIASSRFYLMLFCAEKANICY